MAPRRNPRPLVASFTIFAAPDPRAEMDRFLSARPALIGFARTRACCDESLELLAPFHAELAPLLPALRPLWTHNDLHASNLLWSDNSDGAHATTIIDFGLADRTNAVHDLAHAIERNIVEWLALVNDPAHPDDVPVHFDHLHSLLAGYDSVRQLSREEAAALAPMTALCHAEFALSETDYFLSVLHREDQAPMACDGWLVGHARWFRGAGGKLLNALRTWAAERKPNGDSRQMSWMAIANYLAANWLEIAGFVTTLVGIWLTTRRLLICWPVVLAADIIYLFVFYRARLFSDSLLQVFFLAFTLYGWWHWWRGVREEGEVRVVPLSSARLAWRSCGGCSRRRTAGLADGARGRGAATSGCGADQLQPCRKLVAGAQAHGQLVAVDCRGPDLHRRVCLQEPLGHSSSLPAAGGPGDHGLS